MSGLSKPFTTTHTVIRSHITYINLFNFQCDDDRTYTSVVVNEILEGIKACRMKDPNYPEISTSLLLLPITFRFVKIPIPLDLIPAHIFILLL